MKIKILHLFPDLLNLYGDKGNIEALKHRLLWRGIDCEAVNTTEDNLDLSDADIIFLGGGADREQKLVLKKLEAHKQELKDFAENGGTVIALCGGYQMLGQTLKIGNETVDGLSVLDIYSEQGKNRLIGNVVIESEIIDPKIVGFENHSERTNIGAYTPLGKVLVGYGNTEKSEYEGVVYKNVLATNLHGPLFPKNPKLCDYVLTNTLKHKYPDFSELAPIDDELEAIANGYIVNRFVKE